MNRIIGFFFSVIFAGTAFSQDSLYSEKNFIRDSLHIIRVKLARPQFRFDNRTIFYQKQVLAVGGYDFGVLLKDKMRVTLGYYKLNENISSYEHQVGETKYDRRLYLNYGTINTELTFKNARFYSFGVPLEFGFGRNATSYRTSLNDPVVHKESGFVIVTDFGLSGTFKPIRWVGIRAVVGYRKTVVSQLQDFRFDGIFTSVGLNIDFHEISKDVQMYRLKKRYHRMDSKIGTAVDLITD